MRKLILLAAAALVVSAAFVESASAKTRPITYVTPVELRGSCLKNGGAYGGSNRSYHCVKENCDGKGGACSVECQDGKCTGTTPSRTAGGTVQQILRGGTYSVARNPTTMINNAGTFAKQPTPPSRLIDNAGTFKSKPSATVGVPASGTPNLAMPRAPSQPTLNMQRR